MIDYQLFHLDDLLNAMLDTMHGNVNKWVEQCEIVRSPRYTAGGHEYWAVRVRGSSYLRRIGSQCIWDVFYGEDSEFWSPEHALLALLKAPVPPSLLDRSCWGEPEQCHIHTCCDQPGGRCVLDKGHKGDCRTLASLLADSEKLRGQK